jgi:putative inorganic carbon (hco3(-)) transporter
MGDHIFLRGIREFTGYITRLEVWLLVAAIGLGMLSSRLLLAGIGAAVLLFAMRWYNTGKISRRTPVDAAVVLMAATIPITVFASAIPQTTIPQVLRLVSGIAIFYSLVNWATTAKRIQLFAASLVAAGVALALLAPFSVTWYTGNKLPFIPDSIYDRFIVVVSDTIHPNVMGGILAILIPISFGLLAFSWREFSRLKLFGISTSLALVSVVLFLTKSRGAWLATGAALLLVGLLVLKHRWVKYTAIALTSMAAFYIIVSPSILDLLTASDVVGGVDGRMEIFSRSLLLIQDFPFTGIGMGTFANIVNIFYPFFLYTPFQIVHAHNLFFQIALDLGIPGLIAWLSIYFIVAMLASRTYQLASRQGNQFLTGPARAPRCCYLGDG